MFTGEHIDTVIRARGVFTLVGPDGHLRMYHVTGDNRILKAINAWLLKDDERPLAYRRFLLKQAAGDKVKK
jgi:hypothetical protein